MTTSPRPVPYGVPIGQWSGSCDFRLMPTDEFAGTTSTLTVTEAASGRAALLTYTWTHPEDGAQAGTLMLGGPGEEGDVSAAWVDSWHQPDVVALTGRGEGASASVGYEYGPGWRWEIEIQVGAASVSMGMVNVVPETESAPGVSYDVMRATWT